MIDKRLWTYPELKYITVHQYKLNPEELAAEVNRKFHDGQTIRTVTDVSKIIKGKTIFNKTNGRN